MGSLGSSVDVFGGHVWTSMDARAETSPGEREGVDRFHSGDEEMTDSDVGRCAIGFSPRCFSSVFRSECLPFFKNKPKSTSRIRPACTHVCPHWNVAERVARRVPNWVTKDA